jgi:hypothetical protein
VLNILNMQAIKRGFYSLHNKFFEIISNIFGPPTRHTRLNNFEFVTASYSRGLNLHMHIQMYSLLQYSESYSHCTFLAVSYILHPQPP